MPPVLSKAGLRPRPFFDEGLDVTDAGDYRSLSLLLKDFIGERLNFLPGSYLKEKGLFASFRSLSCYGERSIFFCD